MSDKLTQRLYMLVAGNTNVDDFTALLKKLAEDATDVRISIPDLPKDQDTIVLRKAIHSYINNSIDIIRKTRNNVSTSSVEDD